ncbi:DUF3649 domain-containing protein [Micromonospora haikouensis]
MTGTTRQRAARSAKLAWSGLTTPSVMPAPRWR